MTHDEILALLTRRIAAVSMTGSNEQDARKALDYYLCRPRGDELPGRSTVQSADVADMIEATLAQVLPSFTGDSVCEFEPDAEGDESQCRLESDAVNKVMMEASRGYVVFYEAIKDALQLRNGIIKVWAETEEIEDSQRYQGLTPDQRAYASQPRRPGETVELEDDDDDGTRVRRFRTRTVLRMQAVDPLNFYVDEDHDSPLVDRARACYERKVLQRGELIDLGYSRELVESLPLWSEGTRVNDVARYNRAIRQPVEAANWSGELVEIWETHLLLDKAGTGKPELYRTLSGQGVLLECEATDFIGYATGTAFIQPHRWQGLSMYDKVKGVQDVKTATLRLYIDNMGQCRTAVNSQVVNVDDVMVQRAKGVIRVNGPISDNLMEMPVTDMGPSAQGLLTYMDKVRSERGGAALEMQSGEPGLMSSQIGAQNVADVLTNVELMGAMVARTLAETLIRSAFLLVHRLLRTSGVEPMQLRLADRWVTVDPGTWRARDRINIKAGLSPGERRHKATTLLAVVQQQMQILQGGMDGVLVALPNIYAALRDWCSASGIDAGERYFVDPTGQASSQAVQGKMQQAQQAQQQEQQLQMMQAELAKAQIQLEGQKLQLDKYKADQDSKFNYWREALNAEIEEAKLTGTLTADLQLAEIQGRQRAEAGPGGQATAAAVG